MLVKVDITPEQVVLAVDEMTYRDLEDFVAKLVEENLGLAVRLSAVLEQAIEAA